MHRFLLCLASALTISAFWGQVQAVSLPSADLEAAEGAILRIAHADKLQKNFSEEVPSETQEATFVTAEPVEILPRIGEQAEESTDRDLKTIFH
ncbi:unnamed protein product [Caenorhabditis auriculariae]|uniref:Uncharacterized protein n=1 Tax=Caenorhabditis auriculariae TaxID=2777116 RepID=A0A8S1HR87_9PELO|nr:unnamed protein product [Caenorhabditis auriculariae]